MSARDTVEALTIAVARLGRQQSGNAHEVPGPAHQHIFLLGFPRSGTTLVEQILGTIDGVVTLEEEPTLALAAARLFSPAGMDRLETVGNAELTDLRADYWARVGEAGVDVAGKTFVDMDPFKAPSLPLIARLFPGAKIVLTRRDPRDVVWSCFRQSFAYSPVALELTTVEGAARYYDAVMTLTAVCRETFALNVHEVQYERLIRDFDATTQALCAFLELPWSEALRDFSARARASPVKTASAEQVRRPLYDGSGQWRRYADRLAPIMPILERWI
jgi:hypothetical protein